MTTLVRMSGVRWAVECSFAESNGEVGLDHYETRSRLGWHHHMVLVRLAHHFLVRLRVQLGGVAPALTVEQVRLLIVSVLPTPVFDAAAALRMGLVLSTPQLCRLSLASQDAVAAPRGGWLTLRCNT